MEVFYCPLKNYAYFNKWGIGPDNPNGHSESSYGYNDWIGRRGGWISQQSLLKIPNHSKVPLLADSPDYRLINPTVWPADYWYHFIPRHPGNSGNVLYVDMHIASKTQARFMQESSSYLE